MIRAPELLALLSALLIAAAPVAALGAAGVDVSPSEGAVTWDVSGAPAPVEEAPYTSGRVDADEPAGPWEESSQCEGAGCGDADSSRSSPSSPSDSSGERDEGSAQGDLTSSVGGALGVAGGAVSGTFGAVDALVGGAPLPAVPAVSLPIDPRGAPEEGPRVAAGAPSGASVASTPIEVAAGRVASALAAVASVAVVGAAAGAFTPFLARFKEWAAVLLAPLYTRLTRSDVLGNETRDGIFTRIREQPGITLADLTEGGPVARNAVVHHLRVLEEQGFVASRRVGRTRHFYPNGNAPSAREVAVRSTLENGTTRAIADHVREAPGVAQRDVCERLGISASLAHWHLARLEEAGLVRKARNGRLVQYFWSAEGVIVPPTVQ